MRRRRFLQAGGTGAAAFLAGCSYQTRAEEPPENGTDSDASASSPSADLNAYVAALEEKNIEVDSTMAMAGGVSLMYYYRPNHEQQDRRRLARTFIAYRDIVSSMLAVTVLAPSGDSRRARFHIEKPWANAVAEGTLTEAQYFEKIRSTWPQI